MSIDAMRFASPLPMSVKLIATLQITSLKYTNQRTNTHKVLFALLDRGEDQLSSYQKTVIAQYYFAGEIIPEIKNFFVETYNNEDAIIAFLNKEISIRYFKRNKKKGETNIDTSVRNIINDHLSILLM